MLGLMAMLATFHESIQISPIVQPLVSYEDILTASLHWNNNLDSYAPIVISRLS